jgi:hypothetical protein
MKMHYLETATQPYTVQKPVHEKCSGELRGHKPRRGEEMDNVTLIRVVSGILAVVVLFILIYRMRHRSKTKMTRIILSWRP